MAEVEPMTPALQTWPQRKNVTRQQERRCSQLQHLLFLPATHTSCSGAPTSRELGNGSGCGACDCSPLTTVVLVATRNRAVTVSATSVSLPQRCLKTQPSRPWWHRLQTGQLRTQQRRLTSW
ncbi:hypothetical protein mRhiFer1_009330 [Rhinolophus ferrumequinum]|uniref:Uncharacterized protein n=1 Tax=Rhinolophus ferrumequinum TaxID=59479 RepID=A0A7J7RXP0_RHIFE|nr:hypothetical protein mRhiFer1_009330 [Rhinolophus ferrumequinum]